MTSAPSPVVNPLRPYRVKSDGVIQERAPLLLCIDSNHIDGTEAAKAYMQAQGVTVCLALNHKGRSSLKKMAAVGTYKTRDVTAAGVLRHAVLRGGGSGGHVDEAMRGTYRYRHSRNSPL